MDWIEFDTGGKSSIRARTATLLNVGDDVEGHNHAFDHTTFIQHGSARIEKLDAKGNVVQSVIKKSMQLKNWVWIDRNVCHRIIALESNTIYLCVYAIRNEQGEVIPVYDGWEGAYL